MYLIEFVVIFFALVLCALSAIDNYKKNYKNWQDKKYKKLLNESFFDFIFSLFAFSLFLYIIVYYILNWLGIVK